MNKHYQIVDVWEAHGDGGERGTGPVIGYSVTKNGAETIAAGKGWWGGNGVVREAKALKLPTGELFALAEDKPIDLDEAFKKATEAHKQSGLKKLTPLERKALGLI